jgi:GTP-binding protein
MNSHFVTSSPSILLCPPPDRAEIVMIGKSNVGKSSLINALCHKKELAKTSGKP